MNYKQQINKLKKEIKEREAKIEELNISLRNKFIFRDKLYLLLILEKYFKLENINTTYIKKFLNFDEIFIEVKKQKLTNNINNISINFTLNHVNVKYTQEISKFLLIISSLKQQMKNNTFIKFSDKYTFSLIIQNKESYKNIIEKLKENIKHNSIQTDITDVDINYFY